MISHSIQQAAPKAPAAKQQAEPDVIKLKCATCKAPMRVPAKVLEGKTELPVKCPNPKCGKITRLKKKNQPAETANVPKPNRKEENMNYGD